MGHLCCVIWRDNACSTPAGGPARRRWQVVGATNCPEPLNIDLKRWFDKLTTNGAGARYPFVLSLSKDRWSRH